MPGKGVRRREKNYRAAHGGEPRLPPPPKLRELDALPSKLRRLIAIQNKQNGSGKASAGADASSGGPPGKKREDGTEKNNAGKDKKTKKRASGIAADAETAENRGEGGAAADENVSVDEGKGKRKRGKAVDLRFKEGDANVSVSKKQKRKKYMDERKKKCKGGKVETHLEFPGREKVKFGEIVEAPPKLLFPKVKNPLDASRERIRKEVVENYRNIKGWTSRLGIQLPTLAEKTSL